MIALKNRPPTDVIASVLIFSFLLGVSALSGFLLSLFDVYAAAFVVGSLLLVLCLVIDFSKLFWLNVICAFLLVGQLQYFAGVGKAFWLNYLIAAIAFIRAILLAFSLSRNQHEGLKKSRLLAFSFLFFFITFLTLLASSVINLSPLMQVLLSIKDYSLLWGYLFAVSAAVLAQRHLDSLIKYLPWLIIIQFPVVLYQRFFIAANRGGDSAWDSIVGLFGGDPNGGGASGAMATVTVVTMCSVIARWKNKQVGNMFCLLVIAVALATIMLAEVKFAMVMILVGVMYVYRGELTRKPIQVLVVMAISLFAIFAILVAYQSQFAGARSKASYSLEDYISVTLDRNSDSQQINFQTGEMGRIAAVKFWWQQHDMGSPVKFVIGHGIGASRFGQTVNGEAASQYSFKIARSSLAIVLWESGFIGACSLILALCLALLAAMRKESENINSEMSFAYTTAGVMILMVMIGLAYNTDFVNVVQIQLLAVLMMARLLPSLPAGIHAD
jgi:hypothetical protein